MWWRKRKKPELRAAQATRIVSFLVAEFPWLHRHEPWLTRLVLEQLESPRDGFEVILDESAVVANWRLKGNAHGRMWVSSYKWPAHIPSEARAKDLTDRINSILDT